MPQRHREFDRGEIADFLHMVAPDGLTEDCPTRIRERGEKPGYRCPACGGPVGKRPGRGRPPNCEGCRIGEPVSELRSSAA